jgi:hypothetical protein
VEIFTGCAGARGRGAGAVAASVVVPASPSVAASSSVASDSVGALSLRSGSSSVGTAAYDSPPRNRRSSGFISISCSRPIAS